MTTPDPDAPTPDPDAPDPDAPAGGDEPAGLVVDPPSRLTAVAAATCLLLIVAAALSDAGGRLLALPAAAVAAGLVLRDRTAGPVLRADEAGVDVLQGWRRVRAGWDEVERVRVVQDRRARLLELDLGGRVVALSGTRMGRHPADVAEDLERLRPRGSR